MSLIERILSIFIAAILLLPITGCQKKVKKAASPPEKKITIAYAATPNAALMHIAFAKGYLAEEGLDATPQMHAFGKMTLDAVTGGNADFATVAVAPIVFSVIDNKKIYALAVIEKSNRNEAVVARRDRGITKPQDLKGKKIGLTPVMQCLKGGD